MLWGAFSIKGQISSYSFKTTVDGAYYVEIPQNHLLHRAQKQLWTAREISTRQRLETHK
jgi:hypothetical protein